jgi:hypothetical protein
MSVERSTLVGECGIVRRESGVTKKHGKDRAGCALMLVQRNSQANKSRSPIEDDAKILRKVMIVRPDIRARRKESQFSRSRIAPPRTRVARLQFPSELRGSSSLRVMHMVAVCKSRFDFASCQP